MKKAFLAVVLIAVGLLGLWFFGLPAYKRHREIRAIGQAKDYLANGDYRNASLSARQALRFNPSDLEACIMADLAEKSRSPYALVWRRRIAELAPTIDNRLALASVALRSQGPPYPLAAQTLDELKDSATNVAVYHLVSADFKPARAHELAKQVFSQHPGEAIVTSTYAYSLYLQGRTGDGLAILEKLKADALETPQVALYYGLLLSEAGDTNKAAKYLGIAQKTELLPEEKALVAEAVKRIGARS